MALCADPLGRNCMAPVLNDGMVCDRCWSEKRKKAVEDWDRETADSAYAAGLERRVRHTMGKGHP